MHYLYYCNSTYQLITVLNLHWQRQYFGYENIKNYSADLIMLNAYEGAEEISNRLREEKIFNNVKIIERVRIEGTLHLIKVISNLIFPKSFVKKDYSFNSNDIDSKYDYIYTPKFNRIIAAIWQLNKKAKLQLGEDGVGTYISDLGNDLLPRSYKLLYKLLNHNRDFNNIDKIYVNNKMLYSNNKEAIVCEIPKLNDKFKENLLKLFNGFAQFESNENKIYFFSQLMKEKDSKLSIDFQLKNLIEYREEAIYCPHPRNPIQNEYGLKNSIDKQIWELKILNIKNINLKLLISSHSTACFTPFVLYGYEPYLLLTYKLVNEKDVSNRKNFDNFVSKFINLYSNKEKIMIPENIDEYKKCIEKYKSTL